jgi:hypothetical protein
MNRIFTNTRELKAYCDEQLNEINGQIWQGEIEQATRQHQHAITSEKREFWGNVLHDVKTYQTRLVAAMNKESNKRVSPIIVNHAGGLWEYWRTV